MAEAIWNFVGAGLWSAVSAGSKPAGYVHPLAIDVMREIGLDLSTAVSKSVHEFDNQSFNLVVTVCDNAKEACPIFPGGTEMLHWPFPDPADATGTDDEKRVVFRLIRDQIEDRVVRYVNLGDIETAS